MTFLESMKQRYTTKKYDAATKIDNDKIEELKEILHLTPSSINSQPWKFVIVSDDGLKAKLADASMFNKEKINQSSHLVVLSVFKDVELFEKQIQENLPQGAVDYYNKLIKPLGAEHTQNWMARQVYISLGVLLSAAANMQIDSTPMEGIEPEKYAEILGLNGYEPLVAVALGRRDAEDLNQPELKPKSRVQKDLVLEER